MGGGRQGGEGEGKGGEGGGRQGGARRGERPVARGEEASYLDPYDITLLSFNDRNAGYIILRYPLTPFRPFPPHPIHPPFPPPGSVPPTTKARVDNRGGQ